MYIHPNIDGFTQNILDGENADLGSEKAGLTWKDNQTLSSELLRRLQSFKYIDESYKM